jgi:L-gulono-1,4-lactone dehydrogenase
MTAGEVWRNWSGTVRCAPARTVRPRDVDEIVAAVKRAQRDGQRLRPRGAGHSVTPVAATGDTAVDLAGWTGVCAVHRDSAQVVVRAGTPLYQLNAELDRFGLALTNLGDIDTQTLAGALATGTHGTGLRYGGMPTQVRELEIVLADGTVTRCSATEDPELFAAARTSLGALGVITEVTLQCEPAFALEAREYAEPVEQVLDRLDEYIATNDHFEFYWFPHGRNAMVKRDNRLPANATPRPMHPVRHWLEFDVLENAALGAVCRTARLAPALTAPLNRLCSALVSRRHYSDRSYRVLTTRRAVRFLECEYAFPLAALREVFDELRAAVRNLPYGVMIPAEVRVAAEDDVWLSGAYGRTTAYLSVQQYAGLAHREYFELFESIAASAGGRPHWGKFHTLSVDAQTARYPRLGDFRAVRAKVDPTGLFDSPYLSHVIGPVVP